MQSLLLWSLFKKIGILILIGLTLNATAIAAESPPTDKPKIWLSPEIEIKQPSAKVSVQSASEAEKKEKPGWLSRNKWWVLLGAVAAGAAAALAAGGSGGGDGEEGGVGTYNSDW